MIRLTVALVVIILSGIVTLIAWLFDDKSTSIRSSSTTREFKRRIRQGLDVKCAFEDIRDPGDDTALYIGKITVSGELVVPRDEQPVEWIVNIHDVTNGEDSPMPLFCKIAEFADDNSCYEYRLKSRIPYVLTDISDIDLISVPLFALRGPNRGKRRYRIHVQLLDRYDNSLCFSHGSVLISYEQMEVGYTEIKEHTIKQEECIASLALAMAAADGRISKRETTIINGFFSDRYFHLDDPKERKQRVSSTLQKTMQLLQQGHNSRVLMDKYCQTVQSLESRELEQDAYELCAKVATADNKLDQQEESALKYISQTLDIHPAFVKEVHDREFRLHMFGNENTSVEHQLQMPRSLSRDEKLTWLHSEYRTWRKRQSHKDPDLATEANLKIDLIMKLITELEGQECNDIPF